MRSFCSTSFVLRMCDGLIPPKEVVFGASHRRVVSFVVQKSNMTSEMMSWSEASCFLWGSIQRNSAVVAMERVVVYEYYYLGGREHEQPLGVARARREQQVHRPSRAGGRAGGRDMRVESKSRGLVREITMGDRYDGTDSSAAPWLTGTLAQTVPLHHG